MRELFQQVISKAQQIFQYEQIDKDFSKVLVQNIELIRLNRKPIYQQFQLQCQQYKAPVIYIDDQKQRYFIQNINTKFNEQIVGQQIDVVKWNIVSNWHEQKDELVIVIQVQKANTYDKIFSFEFEISQEQISKNKKLKDIVFLFRKKFQQEQYQSDKLKGIELEKFVIFGNHNVRQKQIDMQKIQTDQLKKEIEQLQSQMTLYQEKQQIIKSKKTVKKQLVQIEPQIFQSINHQKNEFEEFKFLQKELELIQQKKKLKPNELTQPVTIESFKNKKYDQEQINTMKQILKII